MPIQDNTGTAQYNLSKVYDNNGTGQYTLSTIYDNTGTAQYTIFSYIPTVPVTPKIRIDGYDHYATPGITIPNARWSTNNKGLGTWRKTPGRVTVYPSSGEPVKGSSGSIFICGTILARNYRPTIFQSGGGDRSCWIGCEANKSTWAINSRLGLTDHNQSGIGYYFTVDGIWVLRWEGSTIYLYLQDGNGGYSCACPWASYVPGDRLFENFLDADMVINEVLYYDYNVGDAVHGQLCRYLISKWR